MDAFERLLRGLCFCKHSASFVHFPVILRERPSSIPSYALLDAFERLSIQRVSCKLL